MKTSREWEQRNTSMKAMNEPELHSILTQAIANLFEHQSNIFMFTSETGQTEWNLAHHLAVDLRDFFPSLDHDLDVVKWNYDNRRPDIIFHKRETQESNFLVVEVKRDGSPAEVAADIEKINAHWFRSPLHYEFGAVVNLRSDRKHEILVFENTT
jgi:hypothetical protein